MSTYISLNEIRIYKSLKALKPSDVSPSSLTPSTESTLIEATILYSFLLLQKLDSKIQKQSTSATNKGSSIVNQISKSINTLALSFEAFKGKEWLSQSDQALKKELQEYLEDL